MQKNASAAQITGSLSLSKTRPDLNCYRVNGESLRQWPIKSEQSGICSWLYCKKVFYELKIDFDVSSKNLHNWPVLKLLNVYFWSCFSVVKMNFSTFKKSIHMNCCTCILVWKVSHYLNCTKFLWASKIGLNAKTQRICM